MLIDNQEYAGTESLSRSLAHTLDTDMSVFQHFSNGDLVKRIHRVDKLIKVIVDNDNAAVAIVVHDKPYIGVADALQVIGAMKGSYMHHEFNDGYDTILQTIGGVIGIAGQEFMVGRALTLDKANVRSPEAHALLYRIVCSNGAMTMSSLSESSTIQVGNDVRASIQAGLVSFQHSEALEKVIPRLHEAYNTAASGDDLYRFETMLSGSSFDSLMGVEQAGGGRSRRRTSRIKTIIREQAGTARTLTGEPTWSALSQNARQLTSTNVSLGNLHEMATELATHHARSNVEYNSLQRFADALLVDRKPDSLPLKASRTMPARYFTSALPSSSAVAIRA